MTRGSGGEFGRHRRRPLVLWRVLAILAVLLSSAAASAQEGAVRRVHDPCLIRHGEYYYLFSTGRGIPIRRSKDLQHWDRLGRVFDELPDWTRKKVPEVRALWAPAISRLSGEYRLYYSVSTFGSNRSCIGLATNATLDPDDEDYEWVDQGPVICSEPGQDNWNAIDPNVVLDETQRPWMAFGSFWSGIKLLRLDAETGKRSEADTTLHSIAGRGGGAIEAPFIVRKNDAFYLFVSFDQCCQGVDSTYNIRVGRSEQITGPYVDRDGTPMTEGGGTLVLAGHGHVIGPGHNAVLLGKDADWLVHHFYDTRADGVPTLQIRPLLWAHDGWPLAGEPGTFERKPVEELRVTGRWRHSVGFRDAETIEFLENGRINEPDGPHTWRREGRALQLRWSDGDEPDGVRIERCLIGPDGRWYAGRGENGAPVRGTKLP